MNAISKYLLLLSVLLTYNVLNAQEDAMLPLVLDGLDPVLLIEGVEAYGEEDLIATDGHYQYRFASAENLQLFNAAKSRYGIQNEFCPVVPGVGVNPAMYALHQGEIYLFAGAGCVTTFKANPESFVATN
ncbi:MAG: hypothetical protein COC19_06055 [SAR86 cluster bacterium]|uniref:YHS domain-containing protein n=1 Tax=SAR86 cluster bacterium TaxID=2030880 RepID=A0A2A4MKG6_9GAMM|nr:MAG: hypothetical protein COC19_06055 [SAR86 cluster bacterium]